MKNLFLIFGRVWFGGAASMPNPLAVILKDDKNENNNIDDTVHYYILAREFFSTSNIQTTLFLC
ncbi:MAG: hypothetical protein WAT16_06510, partial [Saprospiraceae bacterium]